MKFPVSVCKTCISGRPVSCIDDDIPCNDRVKNLGEYRKFESKLKKRLDQAWRRNYGELMTPADKRTVVEAVMRFLQED